MSDQTEEFLADFLPRQIKAERAMHEGEVEHRLALWSRRDPVTLFGARLTGSGWAELEPIFRELASWFTKSYDYDFELVAAGVSGDLAYTVGYEHNRTNVHGQDQAYTLRVTHVYRRENDDWRIVHRHGDYPPSTSDQ